MEISEYIIDKKSNRYNSGIYIIHCSENKKNYVGSTVGLYHRCAFHFSLLRKGIHPNKNIQYDFNLYADSFEWQVLEIVNKELLVERELYWMNLLKVTDRCRGYNIRSKPNSNAGLIMPQHARDSISKTMTGMKQSLEHAKKQCEARRGRKNTDKQKLKISLGRLKTDIALLKEVKLFMEKNPRKQNIVLKKFGISRKVYEKIRDRKGYYFLYE